MKTSHKIAGTFVLMLMIAVQAVATDYKIDKSNSTVKWNGKKVTGEHYGTVSIKSGSLQVENNSVRSGVIEMDMNTIKVEDIKNESTNQRLTGHLKSDDFFSVEKHPEARLELKKVVHKSGDDYTFTGDLTIKEISHPVTFDALMNVNNGKLTAKGEIEVDRTLYDIRFRSGKFFSDLGDNLIYDTFRLSFDVVANEVSEATSEVY